MRSLALSLSLLALCFAFCNQAKQSDNPHISGQQPPTNQTSTNQNSPAACVNLNRASAEELKTLPQIGDVMAQKIIEYRSRHGGFRRPQELIIIEGFSEKKYRAIANLVCVK
jgi:competence ComEA-like helix-hairpin-helix protein